MIRNVRVPRYEHGVEVVMAVMDTWVETPEASGRAVMAMVDGAEHLLLALEDRRPGKCPRCGHDDPDDVTRTLEGDHSIIVHGPMTFDRIAATGDDVAANQVRVKAYEPYIFVRCSMFDRTMRNLRPEVEQQRA